MKKELDITSIDGPGFLKKMTETELEVLASNIRSFLIDQVAQTGGHLGSNLGVCELTIALYKMYNSPEDKLIWDVGHQAYIHKILTGRARFFHTLRKEDGLSGYLRKQESVHDHWEAGHSSTSLSAALGYALANEKAGNDNQVLAIIGDGAFTAGMAFEAMNHIGAIGTNMTIVLNDNGMSISENIGAIHNVFATDNDADLSVRKLFFEKLGFHYIGPVPGHDIYALLASFKEAKMIKKPVFIHVKTEKGKGYIPAEADVLSKWHGVSPFDVASGIPLNSSYVKDYSETVSDALLEAADQEEFTVITPAMAIGSKLVNFGQAYPGRLIDTGIAEQHAVTLAAGLVANGMKAFVSIYSTFLQRAYDQVLHDVCRQNLNVAFGIDRAGFSGADGDSHHGVFDIAFLRNLPNLVLMMPYGYAECREMIHFSLRYLEGPIAIRYPRGIAPESSNKQPFEEIKLGKWQVLHDGSDAAIITFGPMLDTAILAREQMKHQGYDIMIINARFIKPLDEQLLHELLSKNIPILTIEEHVLAGGFGSSILEFSSDHDYYGSMIKRLGLGDQFYGHGTEPQLRNTAGLCLQSIITILGKLVAARQRA